MKLKSPIINPWHQKIKNIAKALVFYFRVIVVNVVYLFLIVI